MNSTRPKCSYWYKPLSHIHYCLALQNILWITAVKYLVSFYFTRAPALGPQQLAWSLWLLGQESDIMFCQWITFRINQQLRHSLLPTSLLPSSPPHCATFNINNSWKLFIIIIRPTVLSHRATNNLVNIPCSLYLLMAKSKKLKENLIYLGWLRDYHLYYIIADTSAPLMILLVAITTNKY